MEDDLNLNLDELDQIEASADNKLKVKNRFEKLSEKVILEAKAKEEAENKLKVEAEARANAEKERDFFKDFSNLSSKHPAAAEHQNEIFEKVKAGMTSQDATYAVLGPLGKLTPMQPEIKKETVQAEGGSAITNVELGNKELKDMTTDEKLAALSQLEKEGAISLS